jgi:hypothetical protein
MDEEELKALLVRYSEALEDICSLARAGIVGETGLRAVTIAQVALLRKLEVV